jgi:hypothetical protein
MARQSTSTTLKWRTEKMAKKETRPLTKEEYDRVFDAYKAYLGQLQHLSENEEIHEGQRNQLRDAERNPIMLYRIYYK